ncbi:hypothetical protein [Chitiniphilus shinanonensis]
MRALILVAVLFGAPLTCAGLGLAALYLEHLAAPLLFEAPQEQP